MWSLVVYTEERGGRAREEAIIQGMRDSCGVGAWIAMHYGEGRGGTEHTGSYLTLHLYPTATPILLAIYLLCLQVPLSCESYTI